MSPAARVTLASLLSEKSLERVPVSRTTSGLVSKSPQPPTSGSCGTVPSTARKA